MEGQEARGAVIEALIADFQERELPRVTPRSLSLPSLPGKADVVVGMRRSGKTWFLYQQIGSSGARELVQVCADLEAPSTRQRELRALEEGLRETACENATVVTLREEGSAEVGGRTVRIVPAWRWLLEP